MQQVLDDEFLAGLWRRDLLSDLQWYVPECKQANGLPSTRPKPYRTPSWSWASVEADVRYRSVESDILVKVIDASVTPVTEDPTGQVENGFIRLKGSLTAVELCKAQHYELHRNLKVMASIIYLDAETQETGKGFYCLPICHKIYKEPWVAGLILRLSAQGGEMYERF